jgi:hypothetical protein
MKRVFVLLVAVFALTPIAAIAADQQSAKMNGWISDSMCGARHAGTPNVACVKKCIESGSKPVFVDDEKKQVWAIDNPDSITAHYGHHVAVSAVQNPVSKTVHISSVTMLADQGTSK